MPEDDPLSVVKQLWNAHYAAAFPRRWRGVDVAGVEMVSLDSSVAGCVSVWLENSGTLDDRRWDTLATCEQQLGRVLPKLSGAEATYAQRLLDMTVHVLAATTN